MKMLAPICVVLFCVLMKQAFGKPHASSSSNPTTVSRSFAKLNVRDGTPAYSRLMHYRCNTNMRLTEAVAWAEADVLSSKANPIRNQEFLRHNELNEIFVYIYCDEKDNPDDFYDDEPNCSKEEKTCCFPGDTAYSMSEPGIFWVGNIRQSQLQFFTRPTLSEQVRWLKGNPESATDINKLYRNSGATYFHEVLHYTPTIGDKIWD
ncbi:uncharacterized protein LY89DRAFT_723334 [Mollisia scopiformis]|uniref:Uncharacterized protein n=1 Tax=Mollisia scopiformis TaxID=149040 RepID=A0A194WRZ0_MOLSC|nr:uncharacterized protein LY89DRAFT_723334 [Mollisia scopiformis]KUJ10745.1 hypothetical protein LY89DRAFT_723334 [Mollisia scopiformis]